MGSRKKSAAKAKKLENESSRTTRERLRQDCDSTSTSPSRNFMRKTTSKASTILIEPTISRDIQQSRRNTSPIKDKIRSLDKKSKSIQSKAPTTILPMVGSKTSSWLKSYLSKKPEENVTQSTIKSDFEVIYPSHIKFENMHGIQMARLPLFKKKHQSGIIKLVPRARKEKRKTSADIEFVVLFGEATLLMPDKEYSYEEGSSFMVPKGGIYGLENKKRTTDCLLHFHTNGSSENR